MTRISPDPDSQLSLDEQVIERLKLDMDEDLRMIIDSYVESITELLDKIKMSDLNKDKDDIHRWVHSLKSSAASIGAMRLSHLAAEIENLFHKKLAIDLPTGLKQMQQEFQVVLGALKSSSSLA